MYSKSSALTLALGLSTVLACPDHDFHTQRKTRDLSIHKRADPVATEWAYDESYDWAELSESKSLPARAAARVLS